MKDDLSKLKKIAETQEKQIMSMRKVIDILTRRIQDTDARARRNSENLRRATNDINTINRKMRG